MVGTVVRPNFWYGRSLDQQNQKSSNNDNDISIFLMSPASASLSVGAQKNLKLFASLGKLVASLGKLFGFQERFHVLYTGLQREGHFRCIPPIQTMCTTRRASSAGIEMSVERVGHFQGFESGRSFVYT